MQEWMRQAVSVLQLEVSINRNKMRLLNAIDVYVQSFADAAMTGKDVAMGDALLRQRIQKRVRYVVLADDFAEQLWTVFAGKYEIRHSARL